MFHGFDSEPDFINEEGTKWWKDNHTTSYARSPDVHGTILEADGYYVEMEDGTRTRVLIANGKVIEEAQAIDAMGLKIEIRKFFIRNPD